MPEMQQQGAPMKQGKPERLKYRCVACGFKDSFSARNGLFSAGQLARASGWRFGSADVPGIGSRARCPACVKLKGVR